MKYITLYEDFKNSQETSKNILIIVDVQKSFHKYFTAKYLESLKEYCHKFDKVFQIYDNHHKGKSVKKDYLYKDEPAQGDTSDLFDFPNQVDLIEKRYNYDVDADFYKNILDDDVYNEIKSKENSLKKGECFKTTEGTIIVYIGNNHKWFHVPKKLYDLFIELKEAQGENTSITIVGGAQGECLEDVITTAKSLGLIINKNEGFIYSATNCPI